MLSSDLASAEICPDASTKIFGSVSTNAAGNCSDALQEKNTCFLGANLPKLLSKILGFVSTNMAAICPYVSLIMSSFQLQILLKSCLKYSVVSRLVSQMLRPSSQTVISGDFADLFPQTWLEIVPISF